VLYHDRQRRTNARAIDELVALGRLRPDDTVLDSTHNGGRFWSRWRPGRLVAGDLDPAHPVDVVLDATRLPFPDRSFDVVVFDPPYKLVGTPRMAMDADYGVHRYSPELAVLELLRAGTREAIRVARRVALVKCMDQVVSGHQQWQTVEVHLEARAAGAYVADELPVWAPVPQRPGKQVHVRGRPSTFIVIEPPRPSRDRNVTPRATVARGR
jgi:hypothetical protein